MVYMALRITLPRRREHFACGVAAGVWKSSGQVWYMAAFQHSGGELFFKAFSGRMMTVSVESGG